MLNRKVTEAIGLFVLVGVLLFAPGSVLSQAEQATVAIPAVSLTSLKVPSPLLCSRMSWIGRDASGPQ